MRNARDRGSTRAQREPAASSRDEETAPAAAADDANGRGREAARPRRRLTDVDAAEATLALRESEERFRGMLESAPHAVVLADSNGRVAYANAVAVDLFGYGVDELVGMQVDELLPEELRRVHAAERAAYLEAPRGRRMGFGRDLQARRRDGEIVPVEIGLSSFTSGGERYVVVVLADITARKQIEAELRSASENLRALVTASPLATMALDLDGNVRLWNPAAERMFGWAADEVLGLRLPHVPESELAQVTEVLERVGAGEVIAGMELRRQRKDGRVVEAELYAAPQRDRSGRIVGVIEQMADITNRRQMEEALLQAQKMESIGRLAGGIAHDFNNMLTAISGFAQLLLFDLPAGSDQHDSAAAIERAAAQAAALTQQLLAFSRRQVLQSRVLVPDEVIRSMEPMLRRLITEDIALRISLRSDEARVRADPVQLEQVVLNLAVNARDAMPSGGRLLIETARADFDATYASQHFAVAPGRHLMIAVSDSGVGMDAATRSHVFEPFFTTKERGQGTGLGLATIYGIVRQSGGHIWLYSEPGEGTTFKVYFPLVEDEPEAIAEPAEVAGGGTETVLLVEDEAAVRELTRRVLDRQGYDVLVAGDSREALALAADHGGAIDLLISDVVMPGLSGPELSRRIREIRPGTKTLFLSGYTEEIAAEKGRLAGGDGFLSKPFTPEALARKVREIVAASPEATPRPSP